MRNKQDSRIPTSLETYVKQYGIMGTIGRLNGRIAKESNYVLKEFFTTCRDVLIMTRGGKILEAEDYHRT